MGRGVGEAGVKVGTDVKTFYDTQAFQYGVRDKWGYAYYQPNKDKEHKFYPHKPDSNLFIKPWEYGGHPHDFYKASRQARTDDPYVHYETGKALERHNKLVAEVDAWRRRELLQEEMLIQMSKLLSVEKERHRFQELRRHIQLEQLQWSRPSTAQDKASRCMSEPEPRRPGSVNLSTLGNSLRGGCSNRGSTKTRSAPTSGRCSVATKQDLQDLDVFDEKHGF
ncbi:hypothetical protein KC19_3G243100 [Ceratodon purpureus]|uniref:Uncharacterized protein n=1 Tax=Ceratodon purpureus TaxID=3225 RepID=A0A8T0IQ07_CERPU|nr:hypothetical protein KC19_3G243100 [Ceratodon purpureus]